MSRFIYIPSEASTHAHTTSSSNTHIAPRIDDTTGLQHSRAQDVLSETTTEFPPVTKMCLIHFGMGWLQSVASTKFQVSFAEYRLLYRAFLQKRPII